METKSIDLVNQIHEQEFTEKYLLPQRPVVIKNLAKNSVAGNKWTIDYLKKICGNVMVDVFDSSNSHEATAFTDPDLKMKFSKYVDLITNDEPSPLRMFLFNMFKVKPELRKDFPCPSFMKGIMGKMGFMFFGAKGIKVRIHQDMDMSNVLLTQFYGRKKVILVSPKYSELLYKLPLNTHALVDLDKPDYKKYPGLKYVTVQECVLEPGDALFMPSGYWHYITYLDGGFSVSYRKMAFSLKTRLLGFLSVFVFMPVDKILNFILGTWWLSKKEKIAQVRADKAIRNIHKEEIRLQFQHAYTP